MTKKGRNPHRTYDQHGNEIRPMTIGDMLAMGIGSIDAFCDAPLCGHFATLDAKPFPAALPVPDLALKLRCSRCGSKAIQTRANWGEHKAYGTGRSVNVDRRGEYDRDRQGIYRSA